MLGPRSHGMKFIRELIEQVMFLLGSLDFYLVAPLSSITESGWFTGFRLTTKEGLNEE